MPTVFNGTLPIEVYENDEGKVCIKQTSTSGEEQVITLDLMQSEHLANWCIQYAHTATEALMDD